MVQAVEIGTWLAYLTQNKPKKLVKRETTRHEGVRRLNYLEGKKCDYE